MSPDRYVYANKARHICKHTNWDSPQTHEQALHLAVLQVYLPGQNKLVVDVPLQNRLSYC